MGIAFRSVPVGSLILVPEEERLLYIDRLLGLPPNVQHMLADEKTGAYIRGITKVYDLPETLAPNIALNIFLVAIGERTVADLSDSLARDLQVSPDQSMRLSQDLERELFTPIALDLKQRPPLDTLGSGARNVLDLKNQSTPPAPPPLPPRR